MATLPKPEFESRIANLRDEMQQDGTEVFLIYGDEYRREHLRYVSNFWPIFEKGMLAVGLQGEPILLAAPEGQHLADEMSVWKDIRVIPEMEVAYVPEQIEYTSGRGYSRLGDVLKELAGGEMPGKVKVCGIDAMSSVTLDAIKRAAESATVENGDPIVYRLRLIKSQAEIDALSKAWEMCDAGYKAILDANLVGLTEIQAAAIGEKAARDAGAEAIVFSIFCSGDRTNTAIGRATRKVIQNGEMIMAALAVQYEGYIATNEWPFVAGHEPTDAQLDLFRHIIIAEDIGIRRIKDGIRAGDVIAAIRSYFRENALDPYDLYPPIHGNGLAEAESPYPDEKTDYAFRTGMGINFDVSLFDLPGLGSNRIEEGFIVTDDGLMALSPLIEGLRQDFLDRYG
jgi:Xaa-Pro aminopeptidase